MKKFFTSILALCAAAVLIPAGARERSVAEAQKVADSFKSGALTRSAKSSTLAYTSVTPSQGQPCFYVFNREEGGFVIVTADTELPEVIGYSENGSFDYDQLPPAMKWWLSGYEKEISAVYSGLATPAKKIATRAEGYVNIEPLVKTKWDQGAPFNDLCPMDGGTRAWTGCVATSTSQILNYHKYFKGSGTHTDIKNTTMSEDYSALTINWDLMRNKYESTGPNAGTAEQRAEVAKLMKAVGVAIDMGYSKDGSGAYHEMVAHALQKYFGIAKTATFVSKNWYSDDDWVELIYNELKENRPMVYGGASANTAHSFVCDGYRKEEDGDYFHMNWGWGGNWDNWFLLTCLAPEGVGAGGGDGDYSLNQQAVIGIQPPAEGQKTVAIVEGHGETADATIDYRGENGDYEVFAIDYALYTPTTGDPVMQPRGNMNQVWQEPRTFDFQGRINNYPSGDEAGIAEFYTYEWGDVNDFVATKKTLPATYYWKNANDLIWWEYSIWEIDYKFPALPEGKYTVNTEYKLADSDMDWHNVYWGNNVDGTIYLYVDVDGNRHFVTRDELAEMDNSIPVESIEIEEKPESEKVEVKVGDTMKMSDLCDVTITPPDATQKVIWKSLDPNILEVSEDGTAVAKADGEARVIFYTPFGKASAEIMVTVGAGSGVEELENGAEAVSVVARDGVITLNNVPANTQVNVYSVAGVHVASLAGEGTVEVNVGGHGIYVVAVGDKRFKVRL